MRHKAPDTRHETRYETGDTRHEPRDRHETGDMTETQDARYTRHETRDTRHETRGQLIGHDKIG